MRGSQASDVSRLRRAPVRRKSNGIRSSGSLRSTRSSTGHQSRCGATSTTMTCPTTSFTIRIIRASDARTARVPSAPARMPEPDAGLVSPRPSVDFTSLSRLRPHRKFLPPRVPNVGCDLAGLAECAGDASPVTNYFCLREKHLVQTLNGFHSLRVIYKEGDRPVRSPLAHDTHVHIRDGRESATSNIGIASNVLADQTNQRSVILPPNIS